MMIYILAAVLLFLSQPGPVVAEAGARRLMMIG